jgi:hypothetical protein
MPRLSYEVICANYIIVSPESSLPLSHKANDVITPAAQAAETTEVYIVSQTYQKPCSQVVRHVPEKKRLDTNKRDTEVPY